MMRAFEKSPLAFSPVGAFILAALFLTGAKNVTPGEVMWQEGVVYRTEGRQYQQQGDLWQAATAYRKAIAVKPDYAEAYNDLGVVLESAGDAAGAEGAYKAALKFKPDLASAHSNLALFYEEHNRVKEAAVHWGARVRAGPPDDPWVIKAREKLTQYHLTVPETETEKAGKRAKEIRVAIETGRADLEAKQYDKAVSEFERALKMDPANAGAARLLRSARTQAQREERARQKDRELKAAKQMKELEEVRRKAAEAERKAQEAESEKTMEAAKRIEAEKRAEEIQKRAAIGEKIREKEKAARQAEEAKQRAIKTERRADQTRPTARQAVEAARKTKAAHAVPPAPVQIAVPKQVSTAAAPSEAQAIAREIIKEKSKVRGQTGQELNRRAAAAMREGRYQDAIDTYKQMLVLDPGNRSAKQGLERAQKALAKEAQ